MGVVSQQRQPAHLLLLPPCLRRRRQQWRLRGVLLWILLPRLSRRRRRRRCRWLLPVVAQLLLPGKRQRLRRALAPRRLLLPETPLPRARLRSCVLHVHLWFIGRHALVGSCGAPRRLLLLQGPARAPRLQGGQGDSCTRRRPLTLGGPLAAAAPLGCLLRSALTPLLAPCCCPLL